MFKEDPYFVRRQSQDVEVLQSLDSATAGFRQNLFYELDNHSGDRGTLQAR